MKKICYIDSRVCQYSKKTGFKYYQLECETNSRFNKLVERSSSRYICDLAKARIPPVYQTISLQLIVFKTLLIYN